MYMATCLLVFGFTACKSDDDGINCEEANTMLSEAQNAYRSNIESTDACNAYRMALETVINNGCSGDDEEVINTLRQELAQLGDCTFSGRTCLVCTNSGIATVVCRGENGNAFIDDRDIGIPFARYIELSNCE